MPKTKNAYALRSFDATKILQRRWFKDFNFPVDDDEIFLNVFGKTIEGITTVKNLETITQLGDRMVFYEALLERHIMRLNELQKYYVEKFIPTEESAYKEKLRRVIELTKFYCEENFLKKISAKDFSVLVLDKHGKLWDYRNRN